MAERRMMAKKIIHSDAFLDMPVSTQNLYFHLLLDGDDEGFVNSPKKVQRVIGAGDDDAKLLLAKKFIISFDSGIIVIKHWRMHNYIQKDRFKATTHTAERSMLSVKDNNVYTMDTECIQNVRVGKGSIGEDSIGEVSGDIPKVTFDFLSCWNLMANECGISKVQSITKTRKAKLLARFKDVYLFDDTFQTACELIAQSDFMQGKNGNGWKVTFDWLISNDTNITKVLEGNYSNTTRPVSSPTTDYVNDYFAKKAENNTEVIDAELN